jgi:hypothetical protein
LVYQLKRYGERELDHSHQSISSVCVVGERVGLQGQRAGAESIAADFRLLINRKLVLSTYRMQLRIGCPACCRAEKWPSLSATYYPTLSARTDRLAARHNKIVKTQL